MQLRKFMITAAALAVMALGQSSAQAAYTGNLGLGANAGVTGSSLLTQTSYTFTDFLGNANSASVTSTNGVFTAIPTPGKTCTS